MTTLGGDLLTSRNGTVSRIATPAPAGKNPKAWAAAQDFESVFISNMVSQMFSGLGNEGPMGGGTGTATWRGMLTEEWSKSIASNGGVGLADSVYREIIAMQEGRK